MNVAEVEAEFRRLKVRFESGTLTEGDFKARLEDLMIEDEQGRWWVIGYETGQWYVHDGEKWVQQEPPRTAATAPPERPSAANLADESQHTLLVEHKPESRQKLNRDTVSVLLVAGGWLVCFGGIAVTHIYYGPPATLAIVGGFGGLITGLVLRRTDPPSPWKQVPVVTIGWAVAMAIAWSSPQFYRRFSWTSSGAVIGLVGGLMTALALKWAFPSMQWKHVALVTLSWGIGWAIGGAVGWSLLPRIAPNDFIVTFMYALWGGIAGAIGSWVMFGQVRRAVEGSP